MAKGHTLASSSALGAPHHAVVEETLHVTSLYIISFSINFVRQPIGHVATAKHEYLLR
jgi:hypothetical protein